MDYSLPGSSVPGILQAKILEWAAIFFSRGSSQPRDQTWVSCIAGRFFIIWATREFSSMSPMSISKWIFSSVQFSHSVVSNSLQPHGLQHARLSSLSLTNSQSLLKLMSIKSVMPSNHLILCRPLLLLPSVFPSIKVFSKKSVLHIRWPKYWRFSFSISPSNKYSGLISFKIDWFDLLAVQETLKRLLQHHSSKASILWHSAFFMVQLSYSSWLLENHSFD